MSKNFIQKIQIQNYKCFNSLEIDNLKRVNLISGKNNIGKTALLEAIELFVSSQKIYDVIINIINLLSRRQNKNRVSNNEIEFDLINYKNDSLKIEIDKKILQIKFIEPNLSQNFDIYIDNEEILPEPILEITFNNETQKFPISRLINKKLSFHYREESLKQKVNFISSSTVNEKDIAIFYGNLVDLNKEEFLDKSLQLFDNNFLALKQKTTKRDTILKLKVKNQEKPILLSSLGEGINRFIAILCAIWASKDGYLFIDEIENGIHYTNYDKLWNIIFQASKEADCQIFATTHSKECIESYNRVSNKINDIDITFIEFGKDKQNNIKANVMRMKQLDKNLNLDNGVRGW